MPFPDNQFREIHGMHCLEHFSHTKTDAILKEWNRILEPGGLLRIDVPNMGYWAQALVSAPTDQNVIVHFYGYQDYGDLNLHRTGFTEGLLELSLAKAGFTHILIQDVGAALCSWAYKE
jgi:predicted SAM-dependent methyltransferase